MRANESVNRRQFLKTVSVGAAGAAGLLSVANWACGQTGGDKRPPNLIYILVDDLGYADIGCFGAKDFATPNLDQMAKEGMRFTDYYVQPWCSPTRACLMTGRYPVRNGTTGLYNDADHGLDLSEITIANLLKKRGYTCGLVGKWHLGMPDEYSPIARGFDYFAGLPFTQIPRGANGKKWFPWYRQHWKTMSAGGPTMVENDPDEDMFTQRCTKEAVSFIERSKDKPFFLYLAHPMVHQEVTASKEFKGRSKLGIYGDACEELDWSVGQIIETLKKHKLDENTLIVYSGDNGPVLPGSAKPLRAGKGTTFEGGVRVSCIMRWPGKIPAGKECKEVTSIIDMLPTFTALAGAELPKDRVFDGKDISPLMMGVDGAKSQHEVFCYFAGPKLVGIRMGKWKYHCGKDPQKKDDAFMLVDLESDIGETADVSAKYPDILAKMKERFAIANDELMKAAKRKVQP